MRLNISKFAALAGVLLPSLMLLGAVCARADVVLSGDISEEEILGAPVLLDPRATYLRTEDDPEALDAVPIDLASFGLSPGELVHLKPLGDHALGAPPGFTDTDKQLYGVFSSSNVLLGSTNLNRVQGAVRDPTDDVSDRFTLPTLIGGFPTDIAEDHDLTDTAVHRIPATPVAPASASHLFVSIPDNFFGDNNDPDGDWALRLSRPFIVGNIAGVGGLLAIDDTPGPSSFTRDAIVLANAPGSSGALSVAGVGASLTANDQIYIGLSGSAEMKVVEGGTATTQYISLGRGSVLSPQQPASTLSIDGAGSTVKLDSALGSAPFFPAWISVGRNSIGTANVTGGGKLLIDGTSASFEDSAGFWVARNPGSGGSSLNISGADSEVSVVGPFPFAGVGNQDRGLLTIGAAGKLAFTGESAFLSIGHRRTGDGRVLVSGLGSKIDVTGFDSAINVGHRGTGSLVIEGGAEVDPPFLSVGRHPGGSGNLLIGSTVQPAPLPSRLTLSGNGTALSGDPNGAFFTVGLFGSGAATVARDGIVEIIGGADPVADVFPGFQVGRDGPGALIVDGGQITTSSALAPGPDGAFARVGRVATGVLLITNGGRVLHDLVNPADPTGAADGNTFVGQLQGGQGTVIVTGTDSLWNAGRLLLIAKNFDFAANEPIDPVDDPGGAGAVTVSDEATLVAALTELGPDGNLNGRNATVVGDVLNDGGTVEGGVDFTIDGDYDQIAGTLKIEVRNLAEGGIDSLTVNGAADITGGRILMSFADGFLPQTGDDFLILTGNTVNLDPSVSLEFEGVAPGFLYDVTATAGALAFTALNTASPAGPPDCGSFLTSSVVLTGDLNCPGIGLRMSGITANGITLDCNGHSITSVNDGVRISGVNGATVKNCTIVTTGESAEAIRVDNFSSNILINGNNLTTNGTFARAVEFVDIRDSELSNNTMTTLGFAIRTVRLIRSSDNLIDSNTISSSAASFHAVEVRVDSNRNTISNNNIQSTASAVRIRAGSEDNLIIGNTIRTNFLDGVRFDSSSNNHVESNTFISNFQYLRSRHLPIQNGGLSVAPSGRIFLVENNFGAENGIGTATAFAEIDPATGAPVSVKRLVTSGGAFSFDTGLDALEITPDGRFLGFGGNDNTLYEIDPNLATIRPLGLSLPALAGTLNGLEALSATRLLATTNRGELVSIDLGTSTANLLGAAGPGWTGISVDPSTGGTFAISRYRGEPSVTSHLYEIDPATGAIIREVGDTGLRFHSDLDFAPDGTLYSTDGSLQRLDPATGAATFIGSFGPDPFEPPSANNRLTNNTFLEEDGSIRFTDTVILPTQLQVLITQNEVDISPNRAFVDTDALPFLDRPARITLNDITDDALVLLVDLEDDGEFVLCGTDRCDFVSLTGDTLVFDVTGFTTFSSSDTVRVEVSGPNPGQIDGIESTGPIALDGVRLEIVFVDGYLPEAGDSFEFFSGELLSFAPTISLGGVGGGFMSTIAPTLGPGGSIRFTATNTAPPANDADGDGVDDSVDNCLGLANPEQLDSDGDFIGNACDTDDDNDGVANDLDNCPAIHNPAISGLQEDTDNDGFGNECDNCRLIANPGQEDDDGDGFGNVCDDDNIQLEKRPKKDRNQPPPDSDGDGIADTADNCPSNANATQSDIDLDGVGDACDACPADAANDADNDGFCAIAAAGQQPDNCPLLANPGQEDGDNDGIGDVCDASTDADGDGFESPADCDDTDASVNPGAAEIMNNGKDDDCNPATADTNLRIEFTMTPDPDTYLPKDDPTETVTVTATVFTDTGPTADPVDFTVTSTALPGRYTNDDSGFAGDDFTSTVLANNQVQLVSTDFGGSATIHAEAMVMVGGTMVLVTGDFVVPKDSDGDTLPDAYENLHGGALTPTQDNETTAANPFVGDGLTAFEEYRGFVWGPELVTSANPDYITEALVPEGPAGHFRAGPLLKDLFVKFEGYGGTDPFALGTAFRDAGVAVHVVENSPTLPAFPPNIDVASIRNELVFANGLDCRINKVGIRDWSWDTKGSSGVGSASFYGLFTTTFKCPLDGYFGDSPYDDRAPGFGGELDPITTVEDVNDDGDCGAGNVCDGDTYVVGVFNEELSAVDVDNDGEVELPIVGSVANIDTDFEYTRAQVLKSTITHELGHAVGISHTAVATDLMYEFSNNWRRDGFFSDAAKAQIKIHNFVAND